MSDVRLVGTVDEKGFGAADPCKIEALLLSRVRGAVVEGVNNVKGAREVKGVVKEQAS
jgi:hypothetical protein